MIALALKLWAKIRLSDEAPSGNILLFANVGGGGIGNTIWLYPVMKALEHRGLTVVCEQEEVSRLLSYNLPMATIVKFKDIPNRKYGASVNNFLTQTTENVSKIISLKIHSRIGHIWGDRLKYAWLFNHGVETNNTVQEGESNLRLLEPFGIKNTGFQKLDLPPAKRCEKFDVLIQPHTSNDPNRDYWCYEEVIKALGCKVGLIGSEKERYYCSKIAKEAGAVNLCGRTLLDTAHLMNRARVVVGNDGGLVKLAYAIGRPVIQIVKEHSPYLMRSWIENSTMVSPSPEEVVKAIREKL